LDGAGSACGAAACGHRLAFIVVVVLAMGALVWLSGL
jgi:hypothetical protein